MKQNNKAISIGLLLLFSIVCACHYRMSANILFPIKAQNGKWGFIDKQGKIIISPQYDFASSFINGFSCIQTQERWIFINSKGEKINTSSYESAKPFSCNRAAVCEKKKWGYINGMGRVIIPFHYDKAFTFSNGIALVNVNGKLGYIDTTGKYIITPQFDNYESYDKYNYSDGLLCLCKTMNDCGYYSLNGERKNKMYAYHSYSNGLAITKKENLKGFIDTAGILQIGYQFEDVKRWYTYGIYDEGHYFPGFYNGYAAVQKGGKWGMINLKGEFVIQPIYEDIGTPFQDGLAFVKVNGKWGAIDTKSNFVVPAVYDSITFDENEIQVGFADGLAPVVQSGKLLYIDTKGKIVFPREEK